jgi:hypothetical protein
VDGIFFTNPAELVDTLDVSKERRGLVPCDGHRRLAAKGDNILSLKECKVMVIYSCD